MTKPDPISRQYEIIAAISSQMLQLASSNDWDAVVLLSEQYQEAVEELRNLKPLSDENRLARRKLLTRILDDDARIRSLASPELARLSALLGTMKRHQTVLETYCGTVLSKP